MDNRCQAIIAFLLAIIAANIWYISQYCESTIDTTDNNEAKMIIYSKPDFISLMKLAIACSNNQITNTNNYSVLSDGSYINAPSNNTLIAGFYFKPKPDPNNNSKFNLEMFTVNTPMIGPNPFNHSIPPPQIFYNPDDMDEYKCLHGVLLDHKPVTLLPTANGPQILPNPNVIGSFTENEFQFTSDGYFGTNASGGNHSFTTAPEKNTFISFHELSQILKYSDYIGISGALVSRGNHSIVESDGTLNPSPNENYFTLKFSGFDNFYYDAGRNKRKFIIPSNIEVDTTSEQLSFRMANPSIPAETWAVPCPPRWKEN